MIKFDEKKKLDNIAGGLALRPAIKAVVDKLWEQGCRKVFFLGIGGTWSSSLQVESHARELGTALPVCAENAARFITAGNRQIGEGSCVVISSVSGNTKEIVKAVELLKERGVPVLGFIDEADSVLAKLCDHVITYRDQEQMKFFMTADRFIQNNGEFSEYEDFYRNMEEALPGALVETEKLADEFGRSFAEKHCEDKLHYYVAAGTQWGACYSQAMCYWEEMLWMRTKSIHAGEFFHGTLEIVEKDTPVTLYLGEDSERPLAERVANFLPRVCANYTLIDSKDYPLTGIKPEYRRHISHMVTYAVTSRINAHMEEINKHPMEIRRYYRQFEY